MHVKTEEEMHRPDFDFHDLPTTVQHYILESNHEILTLRRRSFEHRRNIRAMQAKLEVFNARAELAAVCGQAALEERSFSLKVPVRRIG